MEFDLVGDASDAVTSLDGTVANGRALRVYWLDSFNESSAKTLGLALQTKSRWHQWLEDKFWFNPPSEDAPRAEERSHKDSLLVHLNLTPFDLLNTGYEVPNPSRPRVHASSVPGTLNAEQRGRIKHSARRMHDCIVNWLIKTELNIDYGDGPAESSTSLAAQYQADDLLDACIFKLAIDLIRLCDAALSLVHNLDLPFNLESAWISTLSTVNPYNLLAGYWGERADRLQLKLRSMIGFTGVIPLPIAPGSANLVPKDACRSMLLFRDLVNPERCCQP